MKAWKHHIAKDFIDDPDLIHNNGAGIGGTIFLDYSYMVGWLWRDHRKYWVCELEVEPEEIHRIGVFMAVMLVNKLGGPFEPIKAPAYEQQHSKKYELRQITGAPPKPADT